MQLVKPKTKHNPTLTSDIYSYSEVLYISVVHILICAPHSSQYLQYNLSKKLKSVNRLKLRGEKVALLIKL